MTSTTGIRVALCDPHEVVRRGGRALTSLDSAIEISHLGSTVGELYQLAKDESNERPDVILTETHFSDRPDGLETVARVVKEHPQTKVIIATLNDNPTFVAQAVAIGAKAYWLKNDRLSTLVDLIHRVHVERALPEDSMLTTMQDFMASRKVIEDLELTARESQVLRHITLGLTNRDIAASLRISTETVKEHVQNILRKTGWADRTNAATGALQKGYVQLP